MKKALLLLTLITFTLINADTTKMSEEAMINQFMQITKDIQVEKEKQAQARTKTEEMKKLGKTVDKLAKILGTDK